MPFGIKVDRLTHVGIEDFQRRKLMKSKSLIVRNGMAVILAALLVA